MKTTYSKNSNWNDNAELQCLMAYKLLKEADFPRGMQIQICDNLSSKLNISKGSLSAKIANYKSVAGDNKSSNASKNTIYFFSQFHHVTVNQLREIIEKTNQQLV